MKRILIFGPPGTGKTSTLIKLVRSCGVPTEDIAYVLFGRAASEDVRKRVGAPLQRNIEEGDDYPWFRTIHSMAFALLGLTPARVMGPKEWGAFAKLHGYKFTTVTFELNGRPALPTRTEDDKLRSLYEWMRNRMLTMPEALRKTQLRVSPVRFRKYVTRLESYKESEDLLDFTDMIQRAIACPGPPVEVAFIDEAQDLSPLEWAAVDSWFEACAQVYISGDDDQALFGFKAAEPSELVERAKRYETRVLDQSYRVPRAVHAVAQQIISRNKLRVRKEYKPRDADGIVRHASLIEAMRMVDPSEKTLILARNRQFLDEPAAQLRRLCVPFRREGAADDLFDPEHGLGSAFVTALSLSRGRSVDGHAVMNLLRFVPSSRPLGLIPKGIKKYVEDHAYDSFDRRTIELLLDGASLLRVIEEAGPAAVLKRADRDDLAYVRRIVAKYGDLIEAKVVLTTIHASKGREANTVVVIPDMTRASFAELQDCRHGGAEAERRVAYVAVTRAQERLVITQPQSPRAYPYPTRRTR